MPEESIEEVILILCIGEVVTGLQVLSARFQKSEPVWVAGRLHHALSLRLSGKVSISCAGQNLISEAGCLTFTPQGTSYETEVLEPSEIIVIHFTTTGGSEKQPPQVLVPEHSEAMLSHFKALLERYKVGREQDYTCLSILYHILALIQHEELHVEHDSIPLRMHAARKQIDRSFGDSALSVEQLAQQAGVSETYFRREFREWFGTSPSAYLKKIRIENARLLLSTGYYSVSEVAARCGFQSLSYFSYEFHRLTGQTPTEAMRIE